LHPTDRVKNTTVYPLLDNIYLRSFADYFNQVNQAINKNDTFMGIKGSTYVSKCLTIPDLSFWIICICVLLGVLNGT
jgi:hypothetical protein